MGKRVLISLIAIMSLGAIWWTDAGAATCIQYRTVGGSSFCTAWKTGSVTLEVTFKEACLVFGTEVSTCTAQASATSNDTMAFCSTDGGLTATRVKCNQNADFFSTPVGDCVPKHPQDGTTTDGVGHEHHGCTQTFLLEPTPASLVACTTCCTTPPEGGPAPGGLCVDVTPVEMTTFTTVFAADSGFDVFLTQTAQSCGDSSSCSFSELCSINPKKIAFEEVRPYQCNLITEETDTE